MELQPRRQEKETTLLIVDPALFHRHQRLGFFLSEIDISHALRPQVQT
jgi:hypothetical protein